MADVRDLPLSTRLFLKAYPWRRIDPVPGTAPRKPLAQSNVAIVTTAGFVTPDQEPFGDVKGGDTSYRVIDSDVDLATLIETHRSQSFDHTGIRADANLAFPLDRLRELVRDGRIGRVNHRHLSFMGSITAPGRLIRDSAPQAARVFVEDQVDVALLVPV